MEIFRRVVCAVVVIAVTSVCYASLHTAQAQPAQTGAVQTETVQDRFAQTGAVQTETVQDRFAQTGSVQTESVGDKFVQSITAQDDEVITLHKLFPDIEHDSRLILEAVKKILDTTDIEQAATVLEEEDAQYDESAEEYDLLLFLKRKQKTLSRAFIGIQKGTRNYVPMLELARLIRFQADADLSKGTVSGFFNTEDNVYSLDVEKGQYTARGETHELPVGSVIVRDLGLGLGDVYVTIDLLNDLWLLRLNLDFAEMALLIETPLLLPYEREQKRHEEHKRLGDRDASELEALGLEYVPNDYKLISRPAFNIADQIRWNNRNGDLIGTFSVKGKSDLLGTSADYNVSVKYGKGEKPDLGDIRLLLTRRAEKGDELPFGLKLLQLGDVSAKPPILIDNSARGRGIAVSTKPLRRSQTFDSINIEGTAQPGWDVELYRDRKLLDFGVVAGNGEYHFTDVPLNFGKNKLIVRLYGPEGQIEEREEIYDIAHNMLRPGETVFEGIAIDANRLLITVTEESRAVEGKPFQNFIAKRGINNWLTAFATATKMRTKEGDKTYITTGADIAALGGIGRVEVYKNLGGGKAVDTRFSTRFGRLNLNLSAAVFSGFESKKASFGGNAKTFEGKAGVRTSFKLPFGHISLGGNLAQLNYKSGLHRTTINTSQYLGLNNIRFTHSTGTQLENGHLKRSSGQWSVRKRLSPLWEIRSNINYNISPELNFTRTRLNLRYADRNKFSASFNARREIQTANTSLGVSAAYDFGTFLGGASFNMDRGSNEGFDFRLHTNTSLGPFGKKGPYIAQSNNSASQSMLGAHIFLDKDLDGIYSPGDENLEGAQLLVNGRRTDPADSEGYIEAFNTGSGLATIRLDKKSLDNSFLVSAKEGYYTVLRPVTALFIDVPVVETGAIDGTVRFADGRVVSGVRVQLVDADGLVIQETTTFFDGFYNFEFVKPGTYTIQVPPSDEFFVPPAHVQVTSDDLFLYGTDLQLLEQAKEVEAATEANRESGIVPTLHDLDASGTKKPAPHSNDDRFSAVDNRVRTGEHSDRIRPVMDLSGSADYELESETTYPKIAVDTRSIGKPAPRPSDGYYAATVKRIRIGKHPYMIRVVLDLSAVPDYRIAYSQDGSEVIVDLPGTAWNAIKRWGSNNMSVLLGFKTEKLNGGGTRLRLLAKDQMKIYSDGKLPPEFGRGYRIYIDLMEN